MPKNAFLHKKSLLDTFRDDYKVTNPIKAARAERTWDNPIVRHKREKGINKWVHSFAGKKHIHKLARFNAMRNENLDSDALLGRYLCTKGFIHGNVGVFFKKGREYVATEAFNAKDFDRYCDKVLDELLGLYDDDTITRITDNYPLVDKFDKGTSVEGTVADIKMWLENRGYTLEHLCDVVNRYAAGRKLPFKGDISDGRAVIWYGDTTYLDIDRKDGEFVVYRHGVTEPLFTMDATDSLDTAAGRVLGWANRISNDKMDESNKLRYPLKDVARKVEDAFFKLRPFGCRVTVDVHIAPDGSEYGAVYAEKWFSAKHDSYWKIKDNLVAYYYKNGEIIEEFHAEDLSDLYDILVEEGGICLNEGNMKDIKNEKDEPTYVWFGLEHDEDGDYTDSLAVFVDDVSNGMVTVYAHMGQHSSASLDYVAGLEADPNPKGDLYKELIRQGYDNLVVVNTDVAEDMLGIRMHPDDDARELEDPDKYDMYEARTVKTAWTYLERLGKLEGEDSRKEATGKMLDALGYMQGTEGRWYDDEGDEVDIIDVLDNTEWDKAVTMCGPLQESKKDEGRAQCDLCGADMDEDDYDMHGGVCRGCRGPEKVPQGKWIVYLDGKVQGSYKTEPEARDAYKACVGKGDCYYTFKPFGKSEAYYKGKDRGFLVLAQKLIADNWYAKARKEFPGLTLDCYEMDGAGDDMKICFEAYGKEIDDPMSEGLMEIAEAAAKKGCADANRSTDPLIADYGLEANFISWDEPDVFRDQWSYVINLNSKPKGKKGESKKHEGFNTTRDLDNFALHILNYIKDKTHYPGYVRFVKLNDDEEDFYGKYFLSVNGKNYYLYVGDTDYTITDNNDENTLVEGSTDLSGAMQKDLNDFCERITQPFYTESKEPADEKLGYEKGHKNSKGEPAPWVIRSHEDNRVLASFANKDDAYAHLQRMKQYSKTEGLDSYIKDVKALLKSKYGINMDNGKQASLYSGWMEKLDACHYKGLSAEDCAEEVAKFTGLRKSEARPTRQASQIKELCDMCRKDKQVADAVFKALTKDYNTSLDPVLAGQYLTKSWKAKLEELGGCNGWYDGFKKLYADMGVDFICSVLQDLKLGSSEIGCGACTSIVHDIYSKLAKKGETFTGRPQNYSYARIGHEVSTKWIDSVMGDLQDTLKEYNRLSGESVGVAAFTDDAKVDWELYLVGDDKEILHFVDALGYANLMNKYPRLVDFDKVFVQHGNLDDLTNYGITANPYPGTMFDTPKKAAKKVEGLEKNGVIVVPEWLWVAYETGDSSNLSVEEEQILDGFRAMATGKVFDAEAEPSFRAFNDFDDYAGNCYEVQVYTIKEGV